MTKSPIPVTLAAISKLMDQKLTKFKNDLDLRFDKIDTSLEVTNERVTKLRKDMNQRFDQVDDNFGELHTAIQTFVGDAVTPLDKRVEMLEQKIFPQQI